MTAQRMSCPGLKFLIAWINSCYQVERTLDTSKSQSAIPRRPKQSSSIVNDLTSQTNKNYLNQTKSNMFEQVLRTNQWGNIVFEIPFQLLIYIIYLSCANILTAFAFEPNLNWGERGGWIKSALEWSLGRRELCGGNVRRRILGKDGISSEAEFGCNTCQATATPEIGLLSVSSAEDLTKLLMFWCCGAAKGFRPVDSSWSHQPL